jgi:Domain of unknown function (DUF1707)/Cell wall-active antibiotics response 4TMS YvqF
MADNSWVNPQDFNANSRLRASDTDRDNAAAVVNTALAEGRLTPEEHAERLDAIFGAKTHAELVPLLDDLPAPRGVKQEMARQRPAEADLGPRRRRRLVAILSGFSRKGAWQPDPVMDIVCVLGGAELDFRDALLPCNEIVLRITTVLGGVGIIVPPEMRVLDNTAAILGGSDVSDKVPDTSDADSPVLRVEGMCILGGVGVERKARKRPKGLPGSRDVRDVIASLEGGPFPAIGTKQADEGD